MATGVRVEVDLGTQWLDITADVLTRDPLTITQGRPDEGSRTDPGRLAMTVNNRDGRYSPRNPRSPYFGLLGKNAPIRVWMPGGPTHMWIPFTSSYARTPSDGLDLHEDLDLRLDCALDDWQAPLGLMGRWQTGVALSHVLYLLDGGRLQLAWSRDGTTVAEVAVSTVAPSVPAHGRLTVRAVLDVDNGSGGHTATFYVGESVEGPWEVLGDPVVRAGVTSIANAAAPLYVGVIGGRPETASPGKYYEAQLRDGINGTMLAWPIFKNQDVGTESWPDPAGRGWKLSGAAEITDRLDRFHGEIAAWPHQWNVSGEDVHIPIEAAGVLRRLGQGRRPEESTLRRRVVSLNPVAYWPMEEAAGSTRATSPIPDVNVMTVEGLDWAQESSLPSSAPLPKVAGNGGPAGFYGPVPPPAAALTAWQVQFVYRIEQVNATPVDLLRIVSTGTVVEWVIRQGAAESQVAGYDANGAVVFSQSIGTGTDLYGQWITVGFYVTQTGGNVVHWHIAWTDVGGDTGVFFGDIPGAIGHPVAVAGPVGGYPAVLDGMAIGHAAVWHDGVSGRYDRAIDSWDGERTSDRMRRLARESNLALTVSGTAEQTERVGPQGMARTLDLLGECADVDGGILYERREALGLAYRDRSTLYTQSPTLQLRYGQGRELAPPLEPVDDDAHLRNDVTVQRSGGSSGRAVQEDGPLSIAEPPNGVGQYDESITLALYEDDQAVQHAGWRLHLGTWDEARFPSVHVRLHSAPHLLPAACAVRPGDRITIANPPPWLPAETIDLMATGYTEVIGVHTHDITYNCVPCRPWHVASVEHPVFGRVDTDGSELDNGIDATETVIDVAVTDGALWVTAAPPMNSNPDFEADLSGWAPNGATIARVRTPSPAPGAWVMQVIPTGLATFPRAESDVMTVTAGQQYIVSGWMRYAQTRLIQLNINWFDSNGVYMDTSATSLNAVRDTWAWCEAVVTAPVGAARATIAPTVPDTPSGSYSLFVDQVTLRLATANASPIDFPFDAIVGGERMTVVGVTGSASPQAFTVRRSVNGVGKPHQGTTAVALADPSYVAL